MNTNQMLTMSTNDFQNFIAQQVQNKVDFYADVDRDVRAVPMNDYDIGLETHQAGTVMFTKNALSQAVTRMGIGSQYMRKALSHDNEHAAQIMNYWNREQPAERMLRTYRQVGEDNGTLRADVSPTFNIGMDNIDVLKGIHDAFQHEEFQKLGHTFNEVSCYVDPDRMQLKLTSRKLTAELVPGHVVQFGIAIRNGEIGNSSCSIEEFILEVKCANGWIANNIFSRRHVGSRMEVGPDRVVQLADDTRAAIGDAFSKEIRDHVMHSLTEGAMGSFIERAHELDGLKLPEPLKAAEVLGGKLGLRKNEIKQVQNRIVHQRPISGDKFSVFDLMRGITNTANSSDYATDTETVAGDVEDYLDGKKSKKDRVPTEDKPLRGGYNRSTEVQTVGGKALFGLDDKFLQALTSVD